MLRLSLALSAAVLFASVAQAADDGFKTIFDGKSLDGWKISESESSWKLENGVLIANGPRSHIFYVGDDKPFKNFVLELEVQTKENSNGGIYFHTKFQPEGWPAQGHECQVNNSYNSDPQKTASVYKVSKVLEAPAKDNEWFKYTITVKDNNVQVKINDKVVTDYTEDPEALAKDKGIEPQRRVGEGTFCLQAHDPKSVVMYRNIKVKRLP